MVVVNAQAGIAIIAHIAKSVNVDVKLVNAGMIGKFVLKEISNRKNGIETKK